MNMILAIDPSGWTLTIVSVSVVFAVLLILYLAYALIGEIMMRRGKIRAKIAPKRSKGGDDGAEAAAIALAIHCYLNENQNFGVHDKESGIITITKQ